MRRKNIYSSVENLLSLLFFTAFQRSILRSKDNDFGFLPPFHFINSPQSLFFSAVEQLNLCYISTNIVSLNNNQCGSDFQTNDRDILWLVETNTSVIHCCSRKLNNALHRFEFYFVLKYESDLRSTSSLEKHESKYFLFLLNISFCHCL